MKKDNPAKHFIAAFLIAAVLYVIAYTWIEHRRTRKGPWEVTFADVNPPEMIINQSWLGISNVAIIFPNGKMAASENQTNQGSFAVTATKENGRASAPSARTVLTFAQARSVPYPVPFGTCAFMDTTFLPGTVSFTNLFGHEIELLPRVLIIDRQEHPWKSGERILLP